MDFYTTKRKQVYDRLNNEKGLSVTVRTISHGTFDPNTGLTSGSGTATDVTTRGLQLANKKSKQKTTVPGSGDITSESNMAMTEFMVSNYNPADSSELSIVPKAGDELVIGTKTHVMKEVNVVAPGGITIFYKVKVAS